MEDIENLKRRIKKLFALSASSNPNESAAALEKAQKLMQEYSVNMSASDLFNFNRVEVKTPCSGHATPLHETMLMNDISKAFGCRRAYGRTSGDGYYKVHDFIGPEHRVKIASYIADVLLRKMNRERAAYIKSLRRIKKRYAKTCRADEFCRGWVYAVTKKLCLQKLGVEEEKALDDYEQSLGWITVSAAVRRTSNNKNDWFNGFVSGEKIEIQQGVGASDRKLAIGAPA
jgi:hypothetical protein